MSQTSIDNMGDGMYRNNVERGLIKTEARSSRTYQHKGGNAGRTKQKLTIPELGGMLLEDHRESNLI
jgi:hypothetical protein